MPNVVATGKIQGCTHWFSDYLG